MAGTILRLVLLVTLLAILGGCGFFHHWPGHGRNHHAHDRHCGHNHR